MSYSIHAMTALLVTVFVTTSCWAGEELRLGFKDIYLGMPGDSLRPILEASCQQEVSKGLSRWQTEYKAGVFRRFSPEEQLKLCLGAPSVQLRGDYEKVGSVDVWPYVTLTDDKVGSILIQFGRQNYEQMREAFIERYGPSTKRSHEMLKNRLGTQFPSELLAWHREEGYLVLFEISGSLNMSEAHLYTRAYRDTLKEDDRSRAKRDARGL